MNSDESERIRQRISELESRLDNNNSDGISLDSTVYNYTNYDNMDTIAVSRSSDTTITTSSVYDPINNYSKSYNRISEKDIDKLVKEYCPFPSGSEQAHIWQRGFECAIWYASGYRIISEACDSDMFSNSKRDNVPQEENNDETEESGFDIEGVEENETESNNGQTSHD